MTAYTTKTVILGLFILCIGIFGISPGYALTLSEAQKLLPSSGNGSDFFGYSMSLSKDTAMIGAIFDDDNGTRSGAVYVLVRDGAGVWREQQKLNPSDGARLDLFGGSVSQSGDTAVIGAIDNDDNGSNSGSAYIYVRDGSGVWSEQQKLLPSDGEAGDNFGHSVSIFGNTAVIGASHDNDVGTDSGSAYVFVRDAMGVWREQQKLVASRGTEGDQFGYSASLFESTAIIGAWFDDDNGWGQGSATVFVRDGTGVWREQQKLSASDAQVGDFFGISVSISGETAVIGAYSHRNGNRPGSAYVFTRDSAGMWNEQQKLLPSDGAASDYFGFSVSISGDSAVIGAFRDDDKGIDSGSVYVYVRDGSGVWHEQQKLTASDGAAGDIFGFSVAASGDSVLIGARLLDYFSDESGSVYMFEADDPNNDLLTLEKLINHRVTDTPDKAAQLLLGTRYRAEYKVTNNSPNRVYSVQVFEDGKLVCNLYALDPGESRQRYRCANNQDVLTGLNNVPANVIAKVSGTNQELAKKTNSYYIGFGNEPGKLKLTHYVNNKNADTQGSAETVNGNQAEIVFRVENTGSIKLYRVNTFHDPVSPINSGWQQQCFIGTLMPGQVRYCKRTISVTEAGLNKSFGRAQGEDAKVSATGFVNASNPTYFNVVLP